MRVVLEEEQAGFRRSLRQNGAGVTDAPQGDQHVYTGKCREQDDCNGPCRRQGRAAQSADLKRPKPGVAFGGKYKIIDFVLSNLFNSGIRKVYILTQYRSYSLMKHIRESWGKWTGLGEFFVAITPETSSEREEWFKGTADAIYHYLRFVEATDADYVAIFGGDHIYRMDISQMIDFHLVNEADITVAALEVPVEDARRFGVFSVDDDYRVTAFAEKPGNPRTIPGRATCFASMGNYIFSTKKLIEVLQEGKKAHEDLDFGKHVIPMMLEKTTGSLPIISTTTRSPAWSLRRRATGRMWGPSSPITKPTWTSSTSPRS